MLTALRSFRGVRPKMVLVYISKEALSPLSLSPLDFHLGYNALPYWNQNVLAVPPLYLELA